jgi:hypothetical protein
MKTSFLVLDNEFNRAWNAELIGIRFEVPPSYTAVMESNAAADYKNHAAWKQTNE